MIEDNKGTFIKHIPCEECGSSDNLAVYKSKSGSLNATCFTESCGVYLNHEQLTRVYDIEELDKELTPIEDKPTVDDLKIKSINMCDSIALTDRHVPQIVSHKYGVKSLIVNGKETKRCYPYYSIDGELSGYKVRVLPKVKIYAVGKVGGDRMLFGQQLFPKGGKMLVITAGEEDALASFVMTMKSSKTGQGWPSISLRSCGDIKGVKANLEYINSFEKVVFAVDQEEGDINKAKQMIALLSPGKGFIAQFSENDPSDMLTKGKTNEYWKAIWGAVGVVPSGIIDTIEAIKKEYHKRNEYSSVPFPEMWGLDKCPGLYWPGIATIIGGTGTGKSTITRELQEHLIKNTDYNLGIITLEDTIAKCVSSLISLHTGKRLVLGQDNLSEEEENRAMEALFAEQRLVFCGAVGITCTDDLYSKIRFMAMARDCKIIFLDHITAMSDILGSRDKVSDTDKMVAELTKLVLELDICLIICAHVRKTKSGSVGDKTYETGGIPTEDSIKGSGAIKQYSQQILAIERDKSTLDSPTTVHILKDREFGWLGKSNKMRFNLDKGRFEMYNEVEF